MINYIKINWVLNIQKIVYVFAKSFVRTQLPLGSDPYVRKITV